MLQGENAGTYLSQVESSFTSSFPDGMNKIATAMADSEASRKNAG